MVRVTATSKQSLTLFVAYAKADAGLVAPLLDLLKPRLSTARAFTVETWMDRQLLVGESWRSVIEEHLGHADAGLLLMSPNWLASDFIRNVELPALVAQGKPLLPIHLDGLDFNRSDLGPMADCQIFGMGPYCASFSQSRRRRFAAAAFAAIYDRLVKEYGGG